MLVVTMQKQINVFLSGEDLEMYEKIRQSILNNKLKIKDPEIVRMCIRHYYEHEIANTASGKKDQY